MVEEEYMFLVSSSCINISLFLSKVGSETQSMVVVTSEMSLMTCFAFFSSSGDALRYFVSNSMGFFQLIGGTCQRERVCELLFLFVDLAAADLLWRRFYH